MPSLWKRSMGIGLIIAVLTAAAAVAQGILVLNGSAVPGASVSFSNGVNCSGAPTGSFAAVGGIVTHC